MSNFSDGPARNVPDFLIAADGSTFLATWPTFADGRCARIGDEFGAPEVAGALAIESVELGDGWYEVAAVDAHGVRQRFRRRAGEPLLRPSADDADTWERIAYDAARPDCDYFRQRANRRGCGDCPARGGGAATRRRRPTSSDGAAPWRRGETMTNDDVSAALRDAARDSLPQGGLLAVLKKALRVHGSWRDVLVALADAIDEGVRDGR